MFKNRREAGEKLAIALEKYKNKEDIIVLALPKGGIEVAFEVAKYLNAKFSLLIVRKLPFPDNPEAGFGAIAEDGSMYINKQSSWYLSEKEINDIIFSQSQEIKRRISILRKGEPLPNLTNKTVILIDDGIAAGSTMRAAIMLCKKQGVKKIIVAAPVAGKDVAGRLKELVDELVILEMPYNFRAVAQVYGDWYDVSDEEALEIMGRP
ncbi:MAG: phosphoribosyltransferase [Deltaproteobacteria bacterium]|jgi:predicted phosphoribosyltransferase|nr:phosphoribosyltransferase [Deltaproteobacteria bacterium]MCL5879829.1 phosphoribosyltransferase [Deltaproteobacteria bacterium]MDA8303888.1 phosphoribosyltransferase [Deltaproteobacteria bacterium]